MGIENMTPQWRTGWRSSGQDRRQLREVLQIRNRGEAPCGHVADLIDERITDVDQRIDDLTKLRRDLVSLAGEAKRLDPTEGPPESVCRILTERHDPQQPARRLGGGRRLVGLLTFNWG